MISNFAAAKAAMENPKKDTQGYGYKYATLDQVTAIVDPVCVEHGICWMQYQDDAGRLVTTVNDVESGKEIVKDVRKLGDGNDQQRGSSETYQRRYALLTVFGLAPEDDDGAAASRRDTEKAEPKAPAPKSKNALWAALGKDKALADAVLVEGHPETEEFYKAVLGFWKALEEYAASHGGDSKALAEGCSKRSDAAPTAEWYALLEQEFRSQL